ncbi:MAG: hypothetical protein LBE65_03245 [Synergistaceae bacterium]|nr:hypothetical protein [Synergistaceae bacterium]
MIPIKLNNERVPGKNIKKFFDGTPLMALIQKTCLGAVSLNEVYVYCGNPEVQKNVVNGVRYLQRPDCLDSDEVNCNDIIREFMKSVSADVYVVSHATSPFTRSGSIDICVQKVVSGEFDSRLSRKKYRSFCGKTERQ